MTNEDIEYLLKNLDVYAQEGLINPSATVPILCDEASLLIRNLLRENQELREELVDSWQRGSIRKYS